MARSARQVPAVLNPVGLPGTAWPSDLQAPIADGTNISAPPPQGFGKPPLVSTVGVPDQHKLGMGNAEPTVHGGGG